MGLMDDLDRVDKKGLFRSDDNYVMYSTGILPLDYANGFWQEVHEGDAVQYIPAVGIVGGTIISIIGATGTGKTTFAEQMAYNIIRPFEDGVMYHIDAEKTAIKQRIVQLSQAGWDDPRIRLIKGHTSIEDVLEMFGEICKAKEAGKDKYKYVVAAKGFDGKPCKAYVPTVFIIDSLPQLNGKEFNTDDLGTNTDQMRAAKDVTRFFTNIVDRAWNYNVTFIVINHIRPKADMNRFSAPPRGIMMLGNEESLPRGMVAQYYSNTFFRINTKKSDAYTMEDHGFTGYKCMFQMAKTKTNQVGTSFPVAFNSAKGFDPIYTLYEYAHSLDLIEGRNPYLYLKGLEQFKFNRKDFRKKMNYEKEFREGVLIILKPYLETLLGTCRPETADDAGDVLHYGDLTLEG